MLDVTHSIAEMKIDESIQAILYVCMNYLYMCNIYVCMYAVCMYAMVPYGISAVCKVV